MTLKRFAAVSLSAIDAVSNPRKSPPVRAWRRQPCEDWTRAAPSSALQYVLSRQVCAGHAERSDQLVLAAYPA